MTWPSHDDAVLGFWVIKFFSLLACLKTSLLPPSEKVLVLWLHVEADECTERKGFVSLGEGFGLLPP